MYPSNDVWPVYVDWFVRFEVGITDDWAVTFPTSQSLEDMRVQRSEKYQENAESIPC